MLLSKSLMSLHEPGNLLVYGGELDSFDKETTATFWDDKEEYLLAGPLHSIFFKGADVKSPTEEEHWLDIFEEEFLPVLECIPLGIHLFLFLEKSCFSPFFLDDSITFVGHKPVEREDYNIKNLSLMDYHPILPYWQRKAKAFN